MRMVAAKTEVTQEMQVGLYSFRASSPQHVGFNSFLAEQMKVAGRSGSDTVSLVRVEQTRVGVGLVCSDDWRHSFLTPRVQQA